MNNSDYKMFFFLKPTTPRAERKEKEDKEKEDHYGFIVRPGDDQLH